LVNPASFNTAQSAWLAVMIAIAHASQFIFNVPIASGKQNMPASDTPGFNAPLRLIFVVDGYVDGFQRGAGGGDAFSQ
jgi:hypothetical protein